MGKYRISADIGGTFTDMVIYNKESHETITGKVLSTPDNPAEAVLNGLAKYLDDSSEIDFLVHGTTVGLNSFLERKGSRVLLIMTEGLKDSYTIARGDRKVIYELQYRKPKLLTERSDVHEVGGRLRWDGSEYAPLAEGDLQAIIEKVKAEDIKSVAVCLLHAYKNPEHELRVRELLKQALDDDVVITLSHEMAREWREYERASTAVMNGYIAPVVNRYLTSLTTKLKEDKVAAPVHIMQSNGGVIRAETAVEQPIHTLLSGPVGGTIGGVALSESLKRSNLICVDMGGTSFDMSLIIDGRPSISNETEQAGLPLLLPLVEIHTIGAGGGSLAWIEAGALRVGPHSAGSVPGPACYGRGGTQPTVTDANLFLGRIGKDAKLGGWLDLDFAATEQAITSVAKELNLSTVELAEGMLSVINAKMADAIRTITVQQGIDPREFSLVAFGGAGSMHAVWLARELDIKEVVVPWSPGTFSAWGMLQSDIRRDLTENYYHPMGNIDSSSLENVYDQLIANGTALLLEENVDAKDMSFERYADMRYIGQEYFVNIVIEDLDLEKITESFHAAYQSQYGHSTPGAPIEFVNLRVSAVGAIEKHVHTFKAQSGDKAGSGQNPLKGKRDIIFDGKTIETDVLERNLMPVGKQFNGPLVVDEHTATTVIPPGYSVSIEENGHMIIKVEA